MKIEWTLLAKIDYWKNIEYLENHWSEKEVLNFINEINHSLNLLEKGNVIFIKSDYSNVYKMVVIKQITIYYSIEKDSLFLLRFWNNYQDLSNFKLK
ncbi:type II toxin-antitoxin system RelE/ParE family toxin [Flavobacterium nackdongense]|uniref:Type II toxin-antitoxin system RelE/ParE family toxin n=1 Tax=Flavobacterium nackdongense TaxID=2547394 RepID=A0A4P6Y7U8_9FLAO|nr:type II toxin-antitoxin system RelE/ParE family toxin [Flavobacterium nackdongense]QBN18791.1 type II toxin-antitoxin system RelE/ParE family toxin [Flavobacterium nackdongense]